MVREFPFRIGRWSRYLLLPWGVRAGHRTVELDEHRLVVRFGWVTSVIPVADIERWDITGPYRWWRAIGIRHSPFSQDISFCGDTAGAIRLWVPTPRRIAFIRRAREVYLGIEDLEGLGAQLAGRGIPGEDLRAGD